jgi:hypothetical protein
MKNIRIGNYVRVTKRTAKRLFSEGKEIMLSPCNLNPASAWHPGVDIDNKTDEDFDKTVNSFEYYNCLNRETGMYTAFYVKE